MQTRKSTSVKVVLYKSKILANGEHPLMLRVTKNRKLKYVSLGISCAADLWDFNKEQPKPKHPNKELINKIISEKINAYNALILELKSEQKDHTAESLIEKVENQVTNASVFDFFGMTIRQLISTKNLGNSKAYNYCFNVLKRFVKQKDLAFSDIDVRFLTRFERCLLENNFEQTSVSVVFRTLRALYNKAILENVARKTNYPFDTFKVSKFDTSTRKRTLTKTDLKKIEALELSPESGLYEARLYFLFSYYGQGINFNDVAKIKYSNLTENRVAYRRTKTGQLLSFNLLPPAKEAIEFFRPVTCFHTDNYIFPILDTSKHITPTQIDNRIHKVITRVNRDLKKIGELAELPIPLTTYVARHTFANVLKNGGVSTTVIKEAMGHSSESVTQIYLDSFGNDLIDNAMEALL